MQAGKKITTCSTHQLDSCFSPSNSNNVVTNDNIDTTLIKCQIIISKQHAISKIMIETFLNQKILFEEMALNKCKKYRAFTVLLLIEKLKLFRRNSTLMLITHNYYTTSNQLCSIGTKSFE